MKKTLLGCPLLLPFLLACSGAPAEPEEALQPGTAAVSRHQVLVEKQLSKAELVRLQELERQYHQGQAGYANLRQETLREMPKLGPWLAKAMTFKAVEGHDELMRRGFPPRPQEFRKSMHPFFRAARELADLGSLGSKAIRVYLLQDRRSAVRRVGLQLLDALDPDLRMQLLEKEWAVGNTAQRRTVLKGLAGMKGERAGQLLLKACQDQNWQVRGSALPAYGSWAKATGEAAVAAALPLFWSLHREDADGFVRRMALEAIGKTGDLRQVRELVAALEKAMQSGDTRMAGTAANALRSLTRKRFGTKVRAWRAWLGDQ